MNDIRKVVKGGYCIGCGACATVLPASISIIENDYLEYQAKLDNNIDTTNASEVCPFSNSSLNENELAEKLFVDNEIKTDDVVGRYISLYAGHISNEEYRIQTTSGGIITWTLLKLLEKNMIDAVIHIKKTNEVGNLFEYSISKSNEEVLAGAKSRYYPIEMSKVIEFVKNNEGRYAFVGLPCFIKALRNLCIKDKIINERIKFFIGLVCGHLKSKAFAELLAYEAGLDPLKLSYIDFRYKLLDKNADNYGIYLKDVEGNTKTLVSRNTFGTNWGLGFFKYEACDYCDDIFSETADLSVGDAWLEKYTADSKGNSIIVCRNKQIKQLILDGIKNSELSVNEISIEEMRNSQGGGFRHRRSGLSYRLYLKHKRQEWVPKKRIKPDKNSISFMRKLIMIYRMYLCKKSRKEWLIARKNDNYYSFKSKMNFITFLYKFLWQISVYIKNIQRRKTNN